MRFREVRNMKRHLSIFLGVIVLLVVTMACQAAFPQTTVVQTVVVQATAVQAVETDTPPAPPEPSPTVPKATATDAVPVTGAANTQPPAEPSPTAGPQCAILKTINFRKGPGTAYFPPLRALKAGDTVIPQGFNPQGIPSGGWVQALDPAANEVGWLSVDPSLITCNIDLTTLPSVAVAPPPPPPAPVVSNSQVDGEPNGLEGTVHFSPNYLMRMEVRAPDGGKDGDGIKRVTFTISDGSGVVYQHAEGTAGYCIFGGGEPNCNPWTQANGQFYWGEGGPPVKGGTYNVLIVAEPTGADGDQSQFGQWFFDITIQ